MDLEEYSRGMDEETIRRMGDNVLDSLYDKLKKSKRFGVEYKMCSSTSTSCSCIHRKGSEMVWKGSMLSMSLSIMLGGVLGVISWFTGELITPIYVLTWVLLGVSVVGFSLYYMTKKKVVAIRKSSEPRNIFVENEKIAKYVKGILVNNRWADGMITIKLMSEVK